MLARREHSRDELRRKLAGRGHSASAVEQALERLVAERLLDDGRFAQAYTTWRESRGFGPLRIRAELRQRGVDSAPIDHAIDDAAIDWWASARAVRRKKFGDSSIENIRDRAKQTRYLEYRGFTGEQIRDALESTEQAD